MDNPKIQLVGQANLQLFLYTEYHEMPEKACERGFCHVIAFSQFFEMPQHLILKMGKMEHFKKFGHEKVRHFIKLARDKFLKVK